jgi:hypothetical protein
MSTAGIVPAVPASEGLWTHTFDRAATGAGLQTKIKIKIIKPCNFILSFSMDLKIDLQYCRFSVRENEVLMGAFVTEPKEVVQICIMRNVITGALD